MIEAGTSRRSWNDIDMAELDLRKLVVHFAQTKRAEGKSPKTVSWYQEMMAPFLRRVCGLTSMAVRIVQLPRGQAKAPPAQAILRSM